MHACTRPFSRTLLLTCLAGCARAGAATPDVDGRELGRGPAGFAVVELFTSEGCSSCPPADALLRELAADAVQSGARVYPLAFHVDYWDDLGWRDPYSSGWATARQQAYADKLGQRGMYTPEMVINGGDGFVGSDRAHARRGVATALVGATEVHIDARSTREGDDVILAFALSTLPVRHVILRVALVQSQAATHVTVGENAGKLLQDVNVVRAFRTVELDGSLRARVVFTGSEVRRAVKPAVIAFVQNAETMAIIGATSTHL